MLILRYIFTGGLSFRATHQFGPCTFLCNRLTGLINNLLMISICRASALMQGNNTCYFLEEMWDTHFPHCGCHGALDKCTTFLTVAMLAYNRGKEDTVDHFSQSQVYSQWWHVWCTGLLRVSRFPFTTDSTYLAQWFLPFIVRCNDACVRFCCPYSTKV